MYVIQCYYLDDDRLRVNSWSGEMMEHGSDTYRKR